jgi:hypothetical protein
MQLRHSLASQRLAFATLALLWTVFGAGVPRAQATSAISFGRGDVGGTMADSHDRVIGWSFTTNVAITVTELGFFEGLTSGLIFPHRVGIYSSSGVLTAVGTVPSGTAGTLDGLFRYVDIPDRVLAANRTYVIAAFVGGGGDHWMWTPAHNSLGVSSYTVDPSITLGPAGSARFECCNLTGLEFPDQTIGIGTAGLGNPPHNSNAFLGPNFRLLVPEPGTAALTLSGIVWLSVSTRRNRRSTRSGAASRRQRLVPRVRRVCSGWTA